MSLTRSLVVFRHNVRLLLGDPGPVVVFILTPLLVMAILKPTADAALAQGGFPDANGSEHVVPAFAVMFAFFWISFVGRIFFAEHGWGTWERLQATGASQADILTGKLMPAFVIIAAQSTILFIVGALLFDLDSEGPIMALALVGIPLILCVLSLTLALVALCATFTQIDAAGNLLTMIFASLGGALTPLFILPQWAQDIAPATPSYWALKAARGVILEGDGLSAVAGPAAVLLLFASGFSLLAVSRFRFNEAKATGT